jgi:hypothetical protein
MIASTSNQQRATSNEGHSRVTVQPGKKIIDPEIGEDDGAETEDGEDGGASAPPVPGDPGVEEAGIYEPGDERPGLLVPVQ